MTKSKPTNSWVYCILEVKTSNQHYKFELWSHFEIVKLKLISQTTFQWFWKKVSLDVKKIKKPEIFARVASLEQALIFSPVGQKGGGVETS